MTVEKKLVGRVTPEQRDEIRALFERWDSQKRRFQFFFPKENRDLSREIQDIYDDMVISMEYMLLAIAQWWDDRGAEYQWEGRESGRWEINFDTCEVFLNE